MRGRSDIEELCESSLDEVYRYALRLTGGDAHRTADLVQDTYSALVAHVERHPDTDIGVAWLITCCRHRHLDGLRRQRRRRRNEQRSWSPKLVSEIDAGVGDAVLALGQVDEPGRTALVLRHVEGFPVAEIAEAIGRSVAATDSILRRARARLEEVYMQVLESER